MLLTNELLAEAYRVKPQYLEAIANASNEANLIPILLKGGPHNRAVDQEMLIDAVICAASYCEFNITVVADIAIDASPKPREEATLRIKRVEVIGKGQNITKIVTVTKVEVSANGWTNREIVVNVDLAVDREAFIAAANADVVVVRRGQGIGGSRTRYCRVPGGL